MRFIVLLFIIQQRRKDAKSQPNQSDIIIAEYPFPPVIRIYTASVMRHLSSSELRFRNDELSSKNAELTEQNHARDAIIEN